MDLTKIDGSPAANLFRAFLLALNLAVLAVQVPISSLNIFTVLRTSILHRNLKCILLAQSAGFCAWAVVHCAVTFNIFVYGPNHWLDGKAIQAAMVFTIQFGNFIGHPLLVERLLATLMAKKYEHWKSPIFSICWAVPICLMCGMNSYQQAIAQDGPGAVMHFTLGSLIAHIITTTMSLAEIFLFSFLNVHNLKRYKTILNNKGVHNLSERYQLAENIRTARQLAPTVTIHFLIIFVSMIFAFVLYFNIFVSAIFVSLIALTYRLCFSVLNMLVEYTLISRHPILRKQIVQQFKLRLAAISVAKIGKGRVSPANCSGNVQQQIVVETIDGNKLFVEAKYEQNAHFKMLQGDWAIIKR